MGAGAELAIGNGAGAAEEAGGAAMGALGASAGAADEAGGAALGAWIGAADAVIAGAEMGAMTVAGLGCIMLTGGPWAFGLPGAGAWTWPSGIWETWAWMARGRRMRAMEVRILVVWKVCLCGD